MKPPTRYQCLFLDTRGYPELGNSVESSPLPAAEVRTSDALKDDLGHDLHVDVDLRMLGGVFIPLAAEVERDLEGAVVECFHAVTVVEQEVKLRSPLVLVRGVSLKDKRGGLYLGKVDAGVRTPGKESL